MLRRLWCSFPTFARLKSVKSCAFAANVWWFAAVSMCYSSDYIVCLRRKYGAKTAKKYAVAANLLCDTVVLICDFG